MVHLLRDPDEEARVDTIAEGLGMRRVGLVFTQAVGGKASETGEYTMSNREDADDPRQSKMQKEVVAGGKDTMEVDNDFFLMLVKISDHQMAIWHDCHLVSKYSAVYFSEIGGYTNRITMAIYFRVRRWHLGRLCNLRGHFILWKRTLVL
ncbi:NPL4-like protein 1 [Zea mays]|uniref:NPL4-like protein 1 n=1 Tax=Zea mays TaxID=4577 RepID=A0A1D6Q2X7_MAIZE|nr:NPL4-like protein 1 [Zea mays]